MLPELAWRSLWHRRGSTLLTLAAVTLSVLLVIGVEHLRTQARDGFARTLSGVDLVVGARTSPVNLLLYAVFRIGNATNGVSWESYELIGADPRVAWTVPLSLGDSHRGYRVLGTTGDYFEHYHYGERQPLVLREGRIFGDGADAVLGAEVARTLGYDIGSSLTLAHGLGATSFTLHEQLPLTVVGILAPTGTPVDQTVHISLAALDAMHGTGTMPAAAGDEHEDDGHAEPHHDDTTHAHAHEPETITAFLVGLNSRGAVFGLLRDINEYRGEALTALLPGLVLAELWESLRVVEQVLAGISALVMLATLLGLATMLLASMQTRQREIALYRALGAHPSTIVLLVELESLLITLGGIALALLSVQVLLWAGRDWLAVRYGLFIDTVPLGGNIPLFLGLIVGATALLALIPAWSAYRSSLAERLGPAL